MALKIYPAELSQNADSMINLAIYAHYSDNSEVDDSVWNYLHALHEMGFAIFFVSNSPVSPNSNRRLSGICMHVLERPNIGLDFCMWKAALEIIDLEPVERLLLTNSSILGPFHPLRPIFEEAKSWKCGFWGMTENSRYGRHLQSYFLVFEREIIRSSFFMQFWGSVLPLEDKHQIIFSYELGLSNWMAQHGYAGRAFATESRTWASYRASRSLLQLAAEVVRGKLMPPQDVTLEFPDLLLAAGMPFLKRSLLHMRSKRFTPEKANELLDFHSKGEQVT